jgi:enoyl-CoA hydratase / 3-hydroxyacyl-CoA dehydrogenase
MTESEIANQFSNRTSMQENAILSISKISVIGAGQIGPDIILHFAKIFAHKNTPLVLIDISEEALKRAQEKIEKKISRGVDAKVFKPEFAKAMNECINYTADYKHIAGSGIVLEAATEDEMIKDMIFTQVEKLTSEDCIYLSNSSHMQPEVIFRNIKNKSRCLVAHYFFPAEINPVVELVPGEETDAALVDRLIRFYESIGKVPIRVKSSYGYAIDPIFEGLCQTAITCLEKGWGTEKEIDAAAVKALGLGVGPFTALNLTGGNPITAHGLDELGTRLLPWFKTPKTLHENNEKNQAWNTAKRGEIVELAQDQEKKLIAEFQGAYFALAAHIIGIEIVDTNDLNMACEMALVVKPPFALMNKLGISNSHQLVKDFCSSNGFPFPNVMDRALSEGGWKLQDIVTRLHDHVLLITIRRPKALNALNLEVLKQIKSALQNVENDNSVKGAVITGFGIKAFVSGADLRMLASLKTPGEGYNNSHTFQSVLNYIENYKKPVVCALNGFAFGGGNELAMACTARICKKDLRVLVCQPEINLGFIPGAGGTQRLPRLVGINTAAEILRTARNVSSREAVEIGLVLKEVSGDLVAEAIALVKQIEDGETSISDISKEPLSSNSHPEPIDIGHHSKRIDAILVKSIYEGARLSLVDGLELESKMFGECLLTDDMKIGLTNFKTNGPKSQAEFVHG